MSVKLNGITHRNDMAIIIITMNARERAKVFIKSDKTAVRQEEELNHMIA